MIELDSYKNPKEGKTYISPSLPSFGDRTDKVRIASKVIESQDSFAFGTIKDEVVLRHVEGGKSYITAKFIEDPRGLFLLNLQRYTVGTDKPHNASFSFIGEEIGKLFEFIQNVLSVTFKNDRAVNITDEELRNIVVSNNQARKLFQENEEVFSEIIKSEITKGDIIAIGFRKKQLDVYSKLITDQEYFENLKKQKNTTTEGLWQKFFEKNKWIFGYGLSYLFLSSLDEKKLEQVVQGHDVAGFGKRVDALMKTKGLISSLCFVEIKTHETPLLQKKPYRSGCWAPSQELTEAIAQIQGTVASAVKSLTQKISLSDEHGNPTGEEAYNYLPKSYLVIGSLGEFTKERGVNEDQYRSFELYRKNITTPEILTFDELYERTKYIVQSD
ncbi:hypothetical protein MGMO_64c00130 [Methyloglobulus morosus KoM1]|uniref:Shedu protein SduA C-terminal domain-containing protein n=1 Tax=Methyloglobulus morosus KoM1 TaxID=1116472 RepID=V5DY54_9GAMM|nr:Shedu immune nuclease family protein [Methyloglobulus morosus]ESS72251.1 hypothetical protein MGMO_64c00130 [Methyloglobulus morosus KoM1]